MRNQFTIYMTSALHSPFAQDLEDRIKGWLRGLADSANDSVVAKIARDIRSKGDQKVASSDIMDAGKRPDGSFQLRGCAFPSLIIEIGWAQKKSHVLEKAHHYFEVSQGDIRTVIHINLNDIYRKQRAAEEKWARLKEKSEKANQGSPPPIMFLDPTADATCASFSIWRAEGTIVGQDSVHDQVPFSSFKTHANRRF